MGSERPKPPLDRWLSRRLLVTLILAQAVAGVIVWLGWRYEIYDEAKKDLIVQTEGLFSLIRGTSASRPRNDLITYLNNRPESQVVLRVMRNGDSVHTAESFPQRMVPAEVLGLPLFLEQGLAFGQTPSGFRRFLVYRVERSTLPGVSFEFEAALDLRTVEFRAARAFFLVAGTAVMVAGVLSLALSLLTRELTEPLRKVSRVVRSWQPGDKADLIEEDAKIAELLEIEQVLNRMLREVDIHHGRLSKFSTDVAHELRTSIAAAKLELELALNKPRSADEYREVLETVAMNVETLNNTVADLLLIARIEAKQPVLRREKLPVRELLAEVLETFEPFFDDLDLKLHFEADAGIELELDRARFRRVLANLLDNAVKFSESGGDIFVRLKRGEPGEAVLEIQDRGRGMPRQEISRIFERFYRCSNTLEVQGTGLGLPIVRSLIEAHGGRLEVESELNEGALFRIHLPLGQAS